MISAEIARGLEQFEYLDFFNLNPDWGEVYLILSPFALAKWLPSATKQRKEQRGVRVNRASSRRVRPGLRDHCIDLADLPLTHRLRRCGEEERGG